MTLSEGLTVSSVCPWLAAPWQSLQECIQQDRVAHALLIRGPKGVGKTQFAIRYAHRLLCQSPQAEHACGQCSACALLAAGTHPDFQILAPEEEGKAIKVDRVRHVIQDMTLTPQFGGYRVVVIDRADALNANAANALLKSLEEPPEGTVIILVTDRPHQLPATIRSRCRSLAIRAVRQEEALEWLAEQGVYGEASGLLCAASGSPLGALSLRGTDSAATRLLRFEDMMGVISGKLDPLAIAEMWASQAVEMDLAWLASWFLDGARLGLTEGHASIRNHDVLEPLQNLARRVSAQFLLTSYERVLRCQEALRGPANRQLVFEEFFIFLGEGARRC